MVVRVITIVNSGDNDENDGSHKSDGNKSDEYFWTMKFLITKLFERTSKAIKTRFAFIKSCYAVNSIPNAHLTS